MARFSHPTFTVNVVAKTVLQTMKERIFEYVFQEDLHGVAEEYSDSALETQVSYIEDNDGKIKNCVTFTRDERKTAYKGADWSGMEDAIEVIGALAGLHWAQRREWETELQPAVTKWTR